MPCDKYVIEGLDREQHKSLYDSTIEVMKEYDICNLKYTIEAHPLSQNPFNIQAYLFSKGIKLTNASLIFLEKLSDNERKSILAHELSHIKNRDSVRYFIAAAIPVIIAILAFYYVFLKYFPLLTLLALAIIGVITLGLIIIIIPIAIISRSSENRADRDSVIKTGHPEDLVKALKAMKVEIRKYWEDKKVPLITSIVWFIQDLSYPQLVDRYKNIMSYKK